MWIPGITADGRIHQHDIVVAKSEFNVDKNQDLYCCPLWRVKFFFFNFNVGGRFFLFVQELLNTVTIASININSFCVEKGGIILRMKLD